MNIAKGNSDRLGLFRSLGVLGLALTLIVTIGLSTKSSNFSLLDEDAGLAHAPLLSKALPDPEGAAGANNLRLAFLTAVTTGLIINPSYSASLNKEPQQIHTSQAETAPLKAYESAGSDNYRLVYPTDVVSAMQAATILTDIENLGTTSVSQAIEQLNRSFSQLRVQADQLRQITFYSTAKQENPCKDCYETCTGTCVSSGKACFCFQRLEPDINVLTPIPLNERVIPIFLLKDPIEENKAHGAYLASFGDASGDEPCDKLADLAMAKTLDGTLKAGQPAPYLLTITNAGKSSTAGTITVTDSLPGPLTLSSTSGAGWSCLSFGQNITCTSESALAPDATSTIQITAQVKGGEPGAGGTAPGTEIKNCAVVRNDGDSKADNNTGCHTGTVQGGDTSH